MLDELTDMLRHIPTPLADQLVAEDFATLGPVQPVTVDEAYERVGSLIKRPEQATGYAQALTRRAATYRAHRLLAALLVDVLHSQTAGSGVAVMDAKSLISEVMDRFDVRTMRPHEATRHERSRLAWARQAAQVSPLVFARDEYTCRHCGSGENLTVDHKTPLILGGTSDFANLQTLCGSCNSRKGRRPEVAE